MNVKRRKRCGHRSLFLYETDYCRVAARQEYTETTGWKSFVHVKIG